MAFKIEIAKKAIDQCGKNIVEFELAIKAERETIKQYQDYLDNGNHSFSDEALKRGIKASKDKIVIFEEAIEKERSSRDNYYKQIEHNRKQELINLEKEAVVNSIEVINDDD